MYTNDQSMLNDRITELLNQQTTPSTGGNDFLVELLKTMGGLLGSPSIPWDQSNFANQSLELASMGRGYFTPYEAYSPPPDGLRTTGEAYNDAIDRATNFHPGTVQNNWRPSDFSDVRAQRAGIRQQQTQMEQNRFNEIANAQNKMAEFNAQGARDAGKLGMQYLQNLQNNELQKEQNANVRRGQDMTLEASKGDKQSTITSYINSTLDNAFPITQNSSMAEIDQKRKAMQYVLSRNPKTMEEASKALYEAAQMAKGGGFSQQSGYEGQGQPSTSSTQYPGSGKQGSSWSVDWSSPQLSQIAQTVEQEVAAAGFSPDVAAALMGNIAQESSLDPNAYNKKEGAQGLFQYRLERQTNLKNYLQANNVNMSDPLAVTKYTTKFAIEEELLKDPRYKDLVTTLKDPNISLDAKVAEIDKIYERSAGLHTQERQRHAREYLASKQRSPTTPAVERALPSAAQSQGNMQLAAGPSTTRTDVTAGYESTPAVERALPSAAQPQVSGYTPTPYNPPTRPPPITQEYGERRDMFEARRKQQEDRYTAAEKAYQEQWKAQNEAAKEQWKSSQEQQKGAQSSTNKMQEDQMKTMVDQEQKVMDSTLSKTPYAISEGIATGMKALEGLESGKLETGSPLQRLVQRDPTGIGKTLYGAFDKEASDFMFNTEGQALEMLKEKAGGSNISNADLQAVLSSHANLGRSPEDNARIILHFTANLMAVKELQLNPAYDYLFSKNLPKEKAGVEFRRVHAQLVEEKKKEIMAQRGQLFSNGAPDEPPPFTPPSTWKPK